jgi:MarR family transcriptional regulator, 2-MHQ and catechol-resistance regulon repressor
LLIIYLDVKRHDKESLGGGTICFEGWQVGASKTSKINAVDVFLALQKTYRAMLCRVEQSKEKAGLGDSDFRVLEVLMLQGPQPVNVIGGMIGLTTGSITTAVDRMEEKWLVVRRNHPNDRRIRIVELTSRGRKLIEKACTQYAVDMEEAVSCLSREERGILVDLLRKLGKGHNEGAFREPFVST